MRTEDTLYTGQSSEPPKRLRIALVHNAHGEGPKRVLYSLAKGLIVKGHTIDLFAPETANEAFLPLSTLGVNRRTYRWPTHPSSSRLRPFLLQSYVSLARRIRHLEQCVSAYQRIAKDVNAGGYDIAWVDNCQRTETPFILRFLSLPSLVYAHEPKRDWYEEFSSLSLNEGEGSFLRWGYTRLCGMGRRVERGWLQDAARANMLAATRVVTNSRYTQSLLLKAYGVEAQVCYPGVEATVFKPLGVSRERIVLAVGRLTSGERHHLIVEAIGRIRKVQRPRLIVIGGGGPSAPALELQRQAQSLDVRIEIKGYVTDKELMRWYNRAGVVVNSGLKEPFGLVPLEAMACGTPAVGVREGGLQETIEDGKTGLLVEAHPRALAEAIQRILDDSALQQRLGASGIEAVRRFWRWEAAVARFESHLQAAIAVKKGCRPACGVAWAGPTLDTKTSHEPLVPVSRGGHSGRGGSERSECRKGKPEGFPSELTPSCSEALPS